MAQLGRIAVVVLGVVIVALLFGLGQLFLAFPKVGQAHDITVAHRRDFNVASTLLTT